jgi:myosin-1
MALVKDEVVDVVQKDDDGSGWWLVKKNGAEGWAPS